MGGAGRRWCVYAYVGKGEGMGPWWNGVGGRLMCELKQGLHKRKSLACWPCDVVSHTTSSAIVIHLSLLAELSLCTSPAPFTLQMMPITMS